MSARDLYEAKPRSQWRCKLSTVLVSAVTALSANCTLAGSEDAELYTRHDAKVSELGEWCQWVYTPFERWEQASVAKNCGGAITDFLYTTGREAYMWSTDAIHCAARLIHEHPNPKATIGEVLAAEFDRACAAGRHSLDAYLGYWSSDWMGQVCDRSLIVSPETIVTPDASCEVRSTSPTRSGIAVALACHPSRGKPYQKTFEIWNGETSILMFPSPVVNKADERVFYRCTQEPDHTKAEEAWPEWAPDE